MNNLHHPAVKGSMVNCTVSLFPEAFKLQNSCTGTATSYFLFAILMCILLCFCSAAVGVLYKNWVDFPWMVKKKPPSSPPSPAQRRLALLGPPPPPPFYEEVDPNPPPAYFEIINEQAP
ncbi:E3 RID-alpha [Squirrel monkey adenovirus]|nr:E3 RID-alpha [Squirrel monkey adenovirus]